MREIETHKVTGLNEAITIHAADEPGVSGAHHEYICSYNVPSPWEDGTPVRHHYGIKFQQGPIQKVGVNGLSIESLVAICLDRLEGLQSGPFPCSENEEALQHFKKGLEALHQRARQRISLDER
jgi:hypothetical protein